MPLGHILRRAFLRHGISAALVILGWQVPCLADSTLVFNEVMYHPAGDESRLEWIELHSQMAVDMDISGWSIQGGVEFTFPENTIVAGGGFVVIAISPADLEVESGYRGALGPFRGRLANEGERLELRNNSGRLMDWLEYADRGDWPAAADGAGVSLAKLDPDAASPDPRNWRASARMGGTPGAHNFEEPHRRIVLLPLDAEWRHSASGVEPGGAWRTAAYDDSGWPLARGLFYDVRDDGPATWGGTGNRTAPQDFGLSESTARAGGAQPGEIGGYIERAPPASYADAGIGLLDPARHDLSATLTWMQEGNGNVTFGYFLAGTDGGQDDPDGLYWRTDDLNVYAVVKTPGQPIRESLVGTLAAGVASRISMRWHAASRTWSVSLDGRTDTIAVEGGLAGLTLDRFGVLSLGQGAGYGVRFWADDLEYTVATPQLAQRRETFSSAVPAGARTELPRGAATYYFRTTFEYARAADAPALQLQLVARGGAVVYVNGLEVFRHNLPPGETVPGTLTASGSVTDTPAPVVLPASALIDGTNLIAVELHRLPDRGGGAAFGAVLSRPAPVDRQAVPPVHLSEMPSAGAADFWVEIANTTTSPVDLEGYALVRAGESTSEYVFGRQIVPPGGYLVVRDERLRTSAVGDKLWLLTPDRDAVLDAALIAESARARHADTGRWLMPAEPTPGAANRFALQDAVVINEVMYHPAPAGGPDTSYPELPAEWLELHNHGSVPVDLSGWRLQDAVDFEFPHGTTIAPGGYLVVTRDRAYFQRLYPSVEVAGQFRRNLSSRSDRILLLDARGNPADEVRYYDRGYWPQLADGGGSSLELRDPRADNSRPEAWAPSDESTAGQWRSYSYRGVAAALVPGDPGEPHELQLGFLDAPGEVLLDDISVVRDPDGAAVELVPDGDFEGNTSSAWRFTGTHRHSRVIVDPDDPGNHVLQLVAVGPADTTFNHAVASLLGPAPNGEEYRISFRARWRAGSRQLNTRLYYNRLPRTTLLDVPVRAGTPGQRNSRHEANIGPTLEDLRHRPVTPKAGEPVAVTVRAADPDGIASLTLWWSVNEGPWQSSPMDAQAEGRYAASIPGQVAGAIVQFYIEARDARMAAGFSPPGGRDSRALYAVDDGQTGDGRVHTFRTIMLPSDAKRLYEHRQSNERLGGTAVWEQSRAYYDVGVRLRGSLHAGRNAGTVGHSVEFQPHDLFRGVHQTVAFDRDAKGKPSLREIVLQHLIARAGGMPAMYNDIVHAIAPLPEFTGRAMMRMAAHGDVFLDSQYENGSDGTVFESDGIAAETYLYVDFMDLGDDKEAYRWNFLIQNNRKDDDYRGLIALAKTLGLPDGPEIEARAAEVMDVEQWMRVFAMQALAAVNDTYLQDGNHNFRVYQRPSDGRMLAFPWDLDGAFEGAPFPWGNGNLTKVIERAPYQRLFMRHLHDLAAGAFNVAYAERWTRHFGELAGEDFSFVLPVLAQRVKALDTVLPGRVPFELRSVTLSDDGSTAQVEGSGWIDVEVIKVKGAQEPLDLTWVTTQHWQAAVPLPPGGEPIVLEAFDYREQSIGELRLEAP